jgi:hypothetical protein
MGACEATEGGIADRFPRRVPAAALALLGQAVPLPPLPPRNLKEPPTAILLYWQTPEEWAAQIYDWVRCVSRQ